MRIYVAKLKRESLEGVIHDPSPRDLTHPMS